MHPRMVPQDMNTANSLRNEKERLRLFVYTVQGIFIAIMRIVWISMSMSAIAILKNR